MNISPCADTQTLNRIAHHPSVRPFLGLGEEPMDTQWILDLPGTVALMGDLGGFIFLQVREGLYSVHSMFLPEGRGAHAVRAAMDAVAYVFENTQAKAITTEVPAPNLAAKWLARRVGFTEIAKRPQGWQAPSGELWDISDYLLTRPAWEAARSNKRGLN